MHGKQRVILGIVIWGIAVARANAFDGPDANVPLQDLGVMYYNHVTSSFPVAGGMMYADIDQNGAPSWIQVAANPLTLADADEAAQTIRFPSRPPSLTGQWGYGLTGYSAPNPLAMLTGWANVGAGTFLFPSQLNSAGTLTYATSNSPSSTSALPTSPTGQKTLCWSQSVSLYSAFGNGIVPYQPGITDPEGPSIDPDHFPYPLPEDFCQPTGSIP